MPRISTASSVFLDVVYNHLGPDGAYANAFSPHYFTDRHQSPWGRGVNLDGPRSREVRAFFIENALHWVHEYHIDGLRLDATHALQDDSPVHFLAELTTTVRDRTRAAGRLRRRGPSQPRADAASGGRGRLRASTASGPMTSTIRRACTPRTTARGTTRTSPGRPRTSRDAAPGLVLHGPALDVPRRARAAPTRPRSRPKQFVVCIQNHDQIGNRANGARLNHEVDAATFRALSALLLLAPQTPLLFMGQEWAASSPFLFFTDHGEELGRQVTEGRRQEFSAFAAFADPSAARRFPTRRSRRRSLRSRLQWDEVQREPHARMRRLYQRLLQLRAGSGVIRTARRQSCDVRALDEHSLMLTLRGGAEPASTISPRSCGSRAPARWSLPASGRHGAISC